MFFVLNWEVLVDLGVWVLVYGYIFFLFLVVFGIMVIYFLYFKCKIDFIGFGFVVVFVNFGFEIFVGIGVFVVFGFMV